MRRTGLAWLAGLSLILAGLLLPGFVAIVSGDALIPSHDATPEIAQQEAAAAARARPWMNAAFVASPIAIFAGVALIGYGALRLVRLALLARRSG